MTICDTNLFQKVNKWDEVITVLSIEKAENGENVLTRKTKNHHMRRITTNIFMVLHYRYTINNAYFKTCVVESSEYRSSMGKLRNMYSSKSQIPDTKKIASLHCLYTINKGA